MASLKVLGFTAAAAAVTIATASIACPSSSSLSAAFTNTSYLQRRRQGLQIHHGSSGCWLIPPERNLYRGFFVCQAMAIGGTATAEETSQTNDQIDGAALPDTVTEFMVDMKCEGCVSSVRKKLEPLEGVKKVEVDLPNQVVRVQGTTSLKALNEALEQTGRKARLIGQGSSDYAYNAATVAEFKGPIIFGVVRMVQVSMELARIEANFSGLSQGHHGWSINEYGDLTRGAASTGPIYNPLGLPGSKQSELVGDLGVLEADGSGMAEYWGSKQMLRVSDLPGRALVVYETEDKSVPGIAAAVIARSAGIGENYKKLCTCDGTVIWESTNSDFVKV